MSAQSLATELNRAMNSGTGCLMTWVLTHSEDELRDAIIHWQITADTLVVPDGSFEEKIVNILNMPPVMGGGFIQAIKYYREEMGVGLKDAKDAVDKIRVKYGILNV